MVVVEVVEEVVVVEGVVEVEEKAMRIPMIEEAKTPTFEDETGVTTVQLLGLHVHHPLLM